MPSPTTGVATTCVLYSEVCDYPRICKCWACACDSTQTDAPGKIGLRATFPYSFCSGALGRGTHELTVRSWISVVY